MLSAQRAAELLQALTCLGWIFQSKRNEESKGRILANELAWG